MRRRKTLPSGGPTLGSGSRLVYQSQTNARLYSIALYPPAVPSMPYLTGMLMTSNNARTRPIYALPIVFDRLAGKALRRADLQACGVFYKDDPRLDPGALALLDGQQPLW